MLFFRFLFKRPSAIGKWEPRVLPLPSNWAGFGGVRKGSSPEGVRQLQTPCRLG